MLIVYLVLALSIALTLTFAFFNFPWITRYQHLSIGEYFVGDNSKVAFVSDVHLGASGSNTKLVKVIGRALKKLNIDVLVIVGDLIDKRLYLDLRYLERLALLVVEALDLKDIAVLYVPSSSFHDISSEDLGEAMYRLRLGSKNVDFIYAPHVLRIVFKGCGEYIYATHGDYVSRNGSISYLLDKVGRGILNKCITGLIMRKILGLGSGAWVILGHSHVPSIDRRYKAVVLGSWVRRFVVPREFSIAVASCKDGAISISLIVLK